MLQYLVPITVIKIMVKLGDPLRPGHSFKSKSSANYCVLVLTLLTKWPNVIKNIIKPF